MRTILSFYVTTTGIVWIKVLHGKELEKPINLTWKYKVDANKNTNNGNL